MARNKRKIYDPDDESCMLPEDQVEELKRGCKSWPVGVTLITYDPDASPA